MIFHYKELLQFCIFFHWDFLSLLLKGHKICLTRNIGAFGSPDLFLGNKKSNVKKLEIDARNGFCEFR